MAKRKKTGNKMSSSHLQIGWMPDYFDISNRFVYFNSLAYKPPKGPILLGNASKIQAPSINTNEGKAKVEAALQFLSNVAYNEQQKEKEAINYYKDKICKQFSGSEIGKELEKIFNINGGEKIMDVQLKLIEQINIIKQGFTKYKDTLNEILNNQKKTLNELRDKSFRFSHQQFIEKNLFTIPKEKEMEGNLFELINQFIKDFKPNIRGANIYALMTAIALDFQNYINYNMSNTPNDFTEAFKNYIEKGETLLQELMRQTEIDEKSGKRLISSNNIEKGNQELMNIINDVRSEFGIELKTGKQLKEAEDDYKKIINDDTLNKKQKAQAIKQLETKIQQFRSYTENSRKIGNKFLIFSLHTNQSHGDINEVFQTIVERAINIKGSGATDTISYLGQVGIKPDSNFLTKTYVPLKEMADSISKYTDYSSKTQERDRSKKSFEAAQNKYIEMNNKINQEAEKLEKKLDELEIEKMFITHESLKLYANFDSGTSTKLHGRSINALIGLEQIFSLSGTGLTEMDQNIIIHILINLATCCAQQKDPLEKYLSIFAGLLMFDDAYNMAEEIGKNISKDNKVEQIHLYNINGIFVPSSIVLQNIIASFSSNLVNIEEGAKITIKPYSPKDDPKPDTPESWENISNQTIRGTSLNITFLMGLMDIIKKLS